MEIALAEAVWCLVGDASGVGAARREGQRLAAEAGFAQVDCARVGLAITELATNLAKHASDGRLLLQTIDAQSRPTFEILSIDSGPGMQDPDACLRDGYSKAGTSGTGLGAVKRLAFEFDIYSRFGPGTVVLARLQPGQFATPSIGRRWRWGAVSSPAPGETAIGDCWRIRSSGSALSVLVADGLGHGPLAAEASGMAAQVFERTNLGETATFFTSAHQAMRPTRGAAVAMATGALDGHTLQYAGVGNIVGIILERAGTGRGLMSHNGTVGAEMRKIQEFSYEWNLPDRLIMYSDGLQTRWDVVGHPGLLDRHPSVIAAVLHHDYLRGKDDATIVVVERLA